jgi:hypothetical protein
VERWQQIESLFHDALRQPVGERDAWLREACATDTELYREVASLVANHHESGAAGPWAAAAAQLIVKPALLGPGQFLGPYQITSFLAAGGMGEIYRARDTKLKRDVALKVLPEAFARDPGRMARFQREAEVLASLNHPNVAHIYGVEGPALVMEFVEGDSPKGPLPFEDAWKIALLIADALEYAHERGVIHRDLKPANVKLTPDGVVKLLDFGLAKAFSETPDAASSLDPEHSPTVTLGATVAGTVMGTAAYMSPEQAKGKRVDKRADIWSWGVVLYELLTGECLFKGDEAADTLAQVLTKEPDWDRAPVRVQCLLQRCLEKDPKKRLRDIGEARYLLDKSPAPPEPVIALKRSWLAWTAALLAVAAAGFAALRLRPAPLPQVTRFEIHAPPGSTLPLGTPAISPDGRTIAFTANDSDGKLRIYLRPFDRIETRTLPGTEGAVHPFWSPDGRSLAFTATPQRRLKRIDVAGGAARDLSETTAPWNGAWSQDGQILCFCGAAMSRIPAEGGLPTPIPHGKEDQIGHPYFLQDGKRFLVHVEGEKSSIQLATLGSTERTMVLDDADSAPILAPTPQGKTYLLYVQGSDLFGQEFEERSGTLRGKPVLVVSDVGRVAGPAIRATVGVSPAGILAYQTGGEFATGQLTWLDRSGRPVDALPADASGVQLQISPDGLLVAVRKFDASGGGNIWVTDLARKFSSPITFGRNDVRPVWSPNGKRVAFFRVVGKNVGLHIVDVTDGSKDQFFPATIDLPLPGRQMKSTYCWGGKRAECFSLHWTEARSRFRLAPEMEAPVKAKSLPTANSSRSPPMSLAGVKSMFRRCRQVLGKRRCPSTADRAHGGKATEKSCFSFRWTPR